MQRSAILLTLLLAACGTAPGAAPSAFDETGTLTMNTPGLPAGAWHLVYEEPGKPALTVRLAFDDESRCAAAGTEGACRQTLDAGKRARVRGEPAGSGTVLVRRVELE